MTSNVQTFEFTAFTEADLLQGHDRSIGCGDRFTMPTEPTTCFSVTDNDSTLSGDYCRNDRADDRSYQTADIEVDGEQVFSGAKIYMEKMHKLIGSDGKVYFLVEIELQRGGAPGRGDDFFTFKGDVPPAGVELQVVDAWNSGNKRYEDFGAGDKIEEPSDPECIVIEAEDMHASGGFRDVNGSEASGGEMAKLQCGHDGKLKTTFEGDTGTYDLTIHAQDETDGASMIKVFIDGELVDTVILEGQETTHGSDHDGFSEFTIKGIDIPEGAEIKLEAWRDGYEYVRIDKLVLKPGAPNEPEFRVCDDPNAVNIGFEGLATGTIVDDEFASAGITISATGGSGDAMVFDGFNPTGGDTDLATTTQGNILIVSEDGDQSDPDDNIGGTLTFDFDNPSFIFDVKVVDTEEGGTIALFDADGTLINSIEIPRIGNGDLDQVLIDTDGVSQMVVTLNGSGAIDDLCLIPGEEPLGSLSGRYFVDVNRDGLDNDADNAVEGVLVELLDENGVPTGDTRLTDANGNYSFGDLPAGTYGVKFTDTVSGQELIAPNANGNANDDIDSDATDLGGNMSEITGIVVTAGQDTPDNDAGVQAIPGALSGTYFCDENDNAVDDGAVNGDLDVAGKEVVLLNADGSRVVDIDGILVEPVRTDDQGNYRFDNLAAGNYVVMFESSVAEGKRFVAPDSGQTGDADAADDSDVIDVANGKTAPVTVVAGQETMNVDAGVVDINEAPSADDAAGMICAETDGVDAIFFDLAALTSDPENDTLQLTSITDAGADGVLGTADDAALGITDGGPAVTLTSGAEVSLNGQTLTYSLEGTGAFGDVLIRDTASDVFGYTVSDGEFDASGQVDVTVKGALNTLDTIDAALGEAGIVSGQLFEDTTPGGTKYEFNFTAFENAAAPIATALGDALDADKALGLDGLDLTFCLSVATGIAPAPTVHAFTMSVLDADSYSAAVAGAVDAGSVAPGDGGFNLENVDNVNWLINETADLLTEGFTQSEIQRAIWNLLDGGDDNNLTGPVTDPFFAGQPEYADTADAFEITQRALADGEGFVAGSGDVVALVLDPVEDGVQPLVVGVAFDDLAEDCFCF